MPKFNRGAQSAEAASKARSSRPDFLSMKSGDVQYLRPVTDLDDLIEIDVHMGVPTKEAPKGSKSDKWPQQMSAVCQNAGAWIDHYDGEGDSAVPVFEAGYGNCYVCLKMQDVKGKYGPISKTRSQVWGLFAVRQPIKKDGTPAGPHDKIAGFRNVTEEVKDKDGKTVSVPKIVIASQSWSNFWGAFSAAAYMTGSICLMDFRVERTGDADYNISPSTPTPDHAPGTESWEAYIKALTVKDISVEKVLTEQSSPEYYGRFFDPEWKDESGDDGSAGTEDSAGETEISDEKAAAMRGKLESAFATQPA